MINNVINILGFVLYGVLAFSVYQFETIRLMVDQALMLAPELTIGMMVLYYYPFLLALGLWVTRQSSTKHAALLKNQTTIAASVAVSLGLIGTFQGLTAMVNAIAGSMGGEGDITEKMGGMIAAIADALSAMSYAFLTSILGVAISVLLILSLNFWMFRFQGTEKDEKTNGHERFIQQLEVVAEQNLETAKSLQCFASANEKTDKLIEVLEKIISTQQTLSDSTAKGCELIIDKITASHKRLGEEFNAGMHLIIEDMKNSNQTLSGEVEKCTSILGQTANKLIEFNQAHLNEYNEICNRHYTKIEQTNQKILSASSDNRATINELKENIETERSRLKNMFKVMAE